MPVQLRTLTGKIDPVAELLIRDLVQHANELEKTLAAVPKTPQVITQPQPFLLPSTSSSGSGSGITQLTGDVNAGPGSGSQVATLSNTGVAAGTYGDATHVGQFTVGVDGRLSFAGDVLITSAASQLIPLVDGSEPPNFITDGSGNLILTWYP